jgi:hypothetical protein
MWSPTDSPWKRALAAVSLAVALTLAGCVGTAAPYEGSPSPETVEANHEQALRDAGSFTYRSAVNADAGIVTVSANTTAAVELSPDAQSITVNSTGTNYALYAPPEGQAYQRVTAGDTVSYERVDNESVPNASQWVTPPLANVTRAYDFSPNGTEQVGGERTWVYEANTSTLNESTAGPLAEALADREVTNTTIRLYVRSDGLVKRLSYRTVATIAGSEVSVTARVEYTDVGSTRVAEPSWLGDARSVTA